MAETQLPRRLREAFRIVPLNDPRKPYYAFTLAGGTIHASLYLDGSPQEARGQVTVGSGEVPKPGVPVILLEDPSGTVGPGSLAWRPFTGGQLFCWDVQAAVLHQHTTPDLVSQVVVREGWLYWVEHPLRSNGDHETLFRFRRARGNFAEIEDLGQHTLPGLYQWDVNPVQVFATDAHFFLHRRGIDYINQEDPHLYLHQFFFSSGHGSAQRASFEVSLEGEPPVGLPSNAPRRTMGVYGGQLLERRDDPHAEWSEVWPQPQFQLDRSFNVSRGAGADLCLYGAEGGFISSTPTLVRASQFAGGITPHTFQPEADPAAGQPPSFLFAKE